MEIFMFTTKSMSYFDVYSIDFCKFDKFKDLAKEAGISLKPFQDAIDAKNLKINKAWEETMCGVYNQLEQKTEFFLEAIKISKIARDKIDYILNAFTFDPYEINSLVCEIIGLEKSDLCHRETYFNLMKQSGFLQTKVQSFQEVEQSYNPKTYASRFLKEHPDVNTLI